jgi:large subunit ribosomal protein L4
MKIDVFTATGTKKGSMDLPAALFEAPINQGLMQLAVVRQQSNRRHPIAHARHRGEMVGSTKKMYQQKGTGRARRGPIRSPLMKGGGKSFGPRNEANFTKEMPKKMRRNALFSCLSLRAKEGAILALESYPAEQVKTKTFVELLKKLPVELGRRITIVIPARHRGLELSARNVPRVKTLLAPYLNPEDILSSKKIIFLVDAVAVAEKTFIEKKEPKAPKATKESKEPKETKKEAPAAEKVPAKKPARKAPAKPAAKKVTSKKKAA